jgi:hypothetical protein
MAHRDPNPARTAALPGFEFGFTFELDDTGAQHLEALLGDAAAVDPQLDERIANEACPACGRRFADLPTGHAWSLDLAARRYGCSNPVILGEVVARRDGPR